MTSRSLIPTHLGLVHCRRKEGSGFPLVLLHMSPRSGGMYRRVMGLLDRPILAPDRPGFGYSDPPPAPPSMENYAAATLEVLDRLGWETFDLVGTHTGSVEALAIAHLAPERVRHLGMVAVPAYTPEEVAERMEGVAAPRRSPAEDGSHLLEMWQRRRQIRPSPPDIDHLQELLIDELLSAPVVHWAYRAVLRYPTLERITGLGRPLTVLAPHDDLWIQTERIRSVLPAGSRFVELPHLDFDLWWTAPGEMAQLVEEMGSGPGFSMERRSDFS